MEWETRWRHVRRGEDIFEVVFGARWCAIISENGPEKLELHRAGPFPGYTFKCCHLQFHLQILSGRDSISLICGWKIRPKWDWLIVIWSFFGRSQHRHSEIGWWHLHSSVKLMQPCKCHWAIPEEARPIEPGSRAGARLSSSPALGWNSALKVWADRRVLQPPTPPSWGAPTWPDSQQCN